MQYFNRHILAIFCLLVAPTFAFGQDSSYSNPLIDSLKNEFLNTDGEKKVDLLNKIAYNFYYFNNDSTENYALQAIDLANELDYKKGLSEAQRMMGIAYKARNEEGKAIEWLYEGLRTAQSIDYDQGIADNLNSLGIFYNSIEDHQQAISYFQESVAYQIKAKNKLREGIIYSNIAVIYLAKNNLDSSRYFFERSLSILDSIGDERWQAMVYSQYGGMLINQDDLKLAEDYSKKSIDISLRIGQTFHLRKSYQNMAEVHLLRKDYNDAKIMADKALVLSKEVGFFPYLIDVYEVKYRLYSELKQYKKALFFHEKLSQFKDSLRQNQIRNEADLISFQKELVKKEQENLELRKEKETQEVQNMANKALIYRQTIIVIGVLVILIIVIIIAAIFFRLRQKEQDTNKKLQVSNKELEEQKEELSATLQMVEHLNAQLQAQNNTLNKIAIVSITDLEGSIISVNENFCNVTGYNRDELLGNNHNILNSGEHSNETFSEMWAGITSGETWRGELKNKKKNGDFFWGDTAIAPIFNDDGNPKQFFSLQFEITKRKNYLDELTTKGKELEDLNKLKDKLLSIVSHDFRGPLNSLRGTLSLFLQGAISNDELNMLTKDLVEKLDNTYNLLENLLSWAKSQMQGMKVYIKEVDLKSISNTCVDLLSPIASKKLVKIDNKIKAPLSASADNEMVKLILRNLMSNAIKFTAAGDQITLDAKIKDDFVIVSVDDDGLGISNENQDKLFRPDNFSTSGTSNETGMGLGLLRCKDFVEKNGGEIWFESELEKGSTFYFSLPLKS